MIPMNMIALWVLGFVAFAQGQGDRGDVPVYPGGAVQEASCSGSVAGAVLLTIFIVLVIAAAVYYFFLRRLKTKDLRKRDPEAANRASYDNPNFVQDDDGSKTETTSSSPKAVGVVPGTQVNSIATNTTETLEREKTTIEKVLTAMLGSGKIGSYSKLKDDQCLESQQVSVPLQGHDFAGLGFTIQGSLREGIFVKEVLQRGPANESGLVAPGDRLMALTVVTDHMVFEDALTILSYASPYPVLLHLEKGTLKVSSASTLPSKTKMGFSPQKGKPSPHCKNQTVSSSSNLVHPTFRGRSQSFEDLVKIGKIDINKVKLGELASPSLPVNFVPMNSGLTRTENIKLVQRNNETRHSERAIDVPGVEPKSSKGKTDKSSPKQTKKDDVSVEIHQPMRSHVEIDMPDFEVSTEKQSPKDNTDSKTKFGVKVFPELDVKKKVSSGSESSVKSEHKESDQDMNVISPIESDSDSDSKKSKSKANEKSSDQSPTKEKKKLGEKLSFGPFSFGKSSKEETTLKEEKNKSKFGLNFDVPDISIPGFGLSKSKKVKTETKSTGVDKQNKEVEMPQVDISTTTNIKHVRKSSSESGEKSDDGEKEKMKSSDMTFPSMDLTKQIMGDPSSDADSHSPGASKSVSSKIPVAVRERSLSPEKIRRDLKKDNEEIQLVEKLPSVEITAKGLPVIEDSKTTPSTLSYETEIVPSVSSSKQTSANLELQAEGKTIKMEDIDAQINSLESEAFSLAKDNFEDEKKLGSNENYERPPDISPPAAMRRMVFSDPFSDVGSKDGYAVPSSDMLEADFSDEINATDTTKKMKYGIRLEGQDMNASSHRVGQRLPDVLDSERWANNQSDEVKSLNLRAMSPSSGNITVSSTDTSFVSATNPSYTTEENMEFSSPTVLNASDEKKMKVIGVNVMPSAFNIQGVKLKRTSNEESEHQTTDQDTRAASNRMSVSEFAFSEIPVQYDATITSTPKREARDPSGSTSLEENLEITPVKIHGQQDESSAQGFGSAFGFKGFKHHVQLTNDSSDLEESNAASETLPSDKDLNAEKSETRATLVTASLGTDKVSDSSSSESEDERKKYANEGERFKSARVDDGRMEMSSHSRVEKSTSEEKEITMEAKTEVEGSFTRPTTSDKHRINTSEFGISTEPISKRMRQSSETTESDDEDSEIRQFSDSSDSKQKISTHSPKGFKSIKNRIKTELNKMRKHSSSSEDETFSADDDNKTEKRKKSQKKRDKKSKVEDDGVSDDQFHSSSIVVTKTKDSTKANISDSCDSDSERESSSNNGSKRKRRSKAKKKNEESRIVSTGIKDVFITTSTSEIPVQESFSVTSRHFDIDTPTIEGEEMSQVNISRHKVELDNAFGMSKGTTDQQDPKTYVVVKEMKLKQTPRTDDPSFVDEVMEKVTVERQIPRTYLQEERVGLVARGDTDGTSGGSDSDNEKTVKTIENTTYSKNSINLNIPTQRSVTDSEELKRKATSLGDLSRLNEGGLMGSLLERAVSLDLKNASGDSSCLHVRRLQLPDSSATSIEEVDELNSPTKKQDTFGLKSSSRWGTLEEALQLDRYNDIDQMKVQSVTSVPTSISLVPNSGVSISNIEISGDRGASVTALSSDDGIWDDKRDDEPPSLPTSPIPTGKTTITVVDNETTRIMNPKDYRGSDSNIVIVGNDSSILSKNIRNAGVQMSHFSTSQPNIISYSENPTYPKEEFLRTIRSFDSQSQEPLSMTDDGKVTVTMVTSDETGFASNSSGPPVAPKPRNRPHSSPQEMLSFDSGISTPVVTVNTDWIHENGGSVENSDHNLSDEYITPDSSPQKSMTQITLDGPGLSGYTVTEGPFSRTVIVSNPEVPPTEITVHDSDTN